MYVSEVMVVFGIGENDISFDGVVVFVEYICGDFEFFIDD